MGFIGALVDQARPVSKAEAGKVVDGRTLYAPVTGAWFKARLEPPSSSERPDGAGGRRVVVKPPTLMFAMKDKSGELVRLSNEMRLEVSSRELGTGMWEIVGDPTALRKKRRQLGWTAQLRRVETHQADEAA